MKMKLAVILLGLGMIPSSFGQSTDTITVANTSPVASSPEMAALSKPTELGIVDSIQLPQLLEGRYFAKNTQGGFAHPPYSNLIRLVVQGSGELKLEGGSVYGKFTSYGSGIPQGVDPCFDLIDLPFEARLQKNKQGEAVLRIYINGTCPRRYTYQINVMVDGKKYLFYRTWIDEMSTGYAYLGKVS